MAPSSRKSWLAWNGWRMRIPTEWRPLRVYGDAARGHMIVGDAATAVLQIKWWRPPTRRFDPSAWIRRRAKEMHGQPAPLPGARPDGFSHTAWLPQARGKAGNTKAIWYGYAPGPAIVIEIVVNPTLEKAIRDRVAPRVLASIDARKPGEPTRWAIFGASFQTPPEYLLQSQRLHLGDIAIDLRAPHGHRLIVRQVYPASTALPRRPIEKWLASYETKERRIFRPDGPPRPLTLRLGSRPLQGLLQTGRKTLAFPLGCIAARRTARAIVHDPAIDRLLIAKTDTPAPMPDEALVTTAIRNMNWALPDETDAPHNPPEPSIHSESILK